MTPTSRRALLAAGLALPLAPRLALAQPEAAPLRLVVPFPPGQSMDVLPRVLAEALGRHAGLHLVVENKPGGVGTIGTEAVAHAAPDGSVLGIGGPSILSVNPVLLDRQPYDVERDLAPVVRLFDVALAVVVHPDLPVRDMAGLVAWLRANPGTPYASAGPATTPHLAAEFFAQRLGLRLQHVPYRGSGPAMGDLLAGNIRLMFDTVTSAAPPAAAGRVRLLGVLSRERLASLPAVPTVAESCDPGFEAVAWGGVIAPAATPAAVLERLNGAFNTALRDPAVVARYTELGATPAGGSRAEFAAFIRTEATKWQAVVRAAHIRLAG